MIATFYLTLPDLYYFYFPPAMSRRSGVPHRFLLAFLKPNFPNANLRFRP